VAGGEQGEPKILTDKDAEPSPYTFKPWVEELANLRLVPQEVKTAKVTINVPEDATPGGHYAAILIGNRPPEGVSEGGTVNVTSSVATLVFLTVSGDVIEKGRIREFSTEKSVYEKAEARFSLRFENQGNVHLLPHGNIIITNMFGKERGVIPVNEENKNYGNVLPESVREFSFVWTSEAGMWDIGRYKAEVMLVYGKEMKQTAISSTYFYVIPIVPLLQVVVVFLAIILFFGWAVRLYIRKALSIETANLVAKKEEKEGELYTPTQIEKAHKIGIGTLIKPIQMGLVDLRSIRGKEIQPKRNHGAMSTREVQKTISSKELTMLEFMYKYKLFFIFTIFLLVVWLAASIYFEDVMSIRRDYNVSEVRPDGSVIEYSER